MISKSTGMFFILLTCLLWTAEPAAADCCTACCANIDCTRKSCADGTYPTPCCGVGKCNIFCCSCDGGCRMGSGCDGLGGDADPETGADAEGDCKAKAAEQGWERFQQVDSDHDEVLSKEEVRNWMKSATPSRYESEQAFEQGFGATDADGNGEIDLREFDEDVADHRETTTPVASSAAQ